MSCDVFQEALLVLPVEEFGELHAHLSHCEACRAMASRIRHDASALQEGLEARTPSVSFDAVWARAEDEVAQQPTADRRTLGWVALAAAVVLLGVGLWGTSRPAGPPTGAPAPEVAGAKFDAQILELEAQQHSLESRWSELETQRAQLEAEQAIARAQARAAAETAEAERLALESGGHERDWARWLAAERRAKLEADRARMADFALADVLRGID